jgi:hypothetical protein
MVMSKGPMRRLRYTTVGDTFESQTFTLAGRKARVRIAPKENTMFIVDVLLDSVMHSSLGTDVKQLKGLADDFLVTNGIKHAEHRKPYGSLKPLRKDQ